MTSAVRSFSVLETTGDSGTHVATPPSDIELGDLLICVVTMVSGVDYPIYGTGFQLLADWESGGGNATASRIRFYTKRVGLSDPATYTWTHTNVGGSIIGMVAIKNPGAIHMFSVATGNSATPTCPDITTTKSCLIIRIYGADDDNVTTDTGYPGGTTGIFVRKTTGSSASNSSCGGAASESTSAGATGTAAFTIDSSEDWHALTIAIDSTSLLIASTAETVDLNRRRVTYPIKS